MKFKESCKETNTVKSGSKKKKLSIELNADLKELDKEPNKEAENKNNWSNLHKLLMGL